ncbi:RNase adapter RapZ [Deinococcus radiophilus]|uniref:RNase adapter RapZ n=1 Tax=Deinococcus radiophilus TaxID=32062 RepID=A0A3S0KKE5_9DEIO|nr:RNase adapter RapZ [Deinococcus radiophilus]RTR28653.1 RNase adapter RapZ [Deinococcus radiophilus]UFA51075.1 RNase adapter RapZ [Deinococcus radiophilus]
MPFVIVSGLSGSGKSSLLRTLEDSGYLITDNLPPALWLHMYELAQAQGVQDVAVSSDARTRAFLPDLDRHFAELVARDPNVRMIFLEAADEVLLKRYNLSRREHPLGENLLLDFARERELLAPLRALADTVIDTTELTVPDLAQRISGLLKADQRFELRLMSFGFKHAPPRDVDLIIDVRSLPNPYYDPGLRPLTGLDQPVAEHIFASADSEGFYQQVKGFVRTAAERAARSGRHGYSVGIGCTGGQHRSVAVSERLRRELSDLNAELILHRDMPSVAEAYLGEGAGGAVQ